MRVSVMVRDAAGWPRGTRTIDIANTCPVCGGPRGEPRTWAYPEDGEYYHPSVWENPCGHVDKYPACLAEAAALVNARPRN